MRVLIACEFSGTVREAFAARGHDAWSCDLLPTKKRKWALPTNFDLMIAHPPCTHLSVSGARWFESKQVEQRKAIWFFLALANAPIPRIAVENPVSIMSTEWRKPDQIIQPWHFGHPESKATCLWLKNLPKLKPTEILPLPRRGHWENQTPSGQNRLTPSPTRAQDRARTYQGIAEAMADQWG